MPLKCELNGKKTIFGHKVSHSNIKTKRKFKANIKKRKVYIPEEKKWIKMNISTRALRTLRKKSLSELRQS